MSIELPEIRELVPHRDTLLLLSEVLDHDGRTTTCRVAPSRHGWLSRADGSVPAWLAIEYMAQGAAAHESMLSRTDETPPSPGFLIKASRVRLPLSNLAADQGLRVRASRVRGRLSFGAVTHRCVLLPRTGEDPLAEGQLTFSIPRTPATLPHAGRLAEPDQG
jgi:predicted hotdog family 3-hydroxylacyl-ACP dehydratase